MQILQRRLIDRMVTYKKIKQRVYEILCKGDEGDKASRIVDWTIVLLVLLTAATVILESFPDIAQRYSGIFHGLEVIIITTFTVEYLLRVWTADLLYPEEKYPRLKYVTSFMAMIDLMAVLPFWLPFISADFRALHLLRIFHLLRLLSVFKLGRYFEAFEMILRVIRKTKAQLVMFLFILCFLVVFSAILLYTVENPKQPEIHPNIIASLSWTLAVLTTDGSSLVQPVTGWGKLIGSILSVAGVFSVAIPSGILAAGFMTETARNREADEDDQTLETEIKALREKLDLAIRERDDLRKRMEDYRIINASQMQIIQSLSRQSGLVPNATDHEEQNERME